MVYSNGRWMAPRLPVGKFIEKTPATPYLKKKIYIITKLAVETSESIMWWCLIVTLIVQLCATASRAIGKTSE